MKIIINVLIFIVYLLANNGFTQNPEWKRVLPTNTGVPGDYVYSVAIDNDGKKWIAADDPVWDEGGIGVFNDTAWNVLNQFNSGLPNYYVRRIVIESNGTKWISVPGYGIAKYNGITWTIYNTSNSPLPSNSITGIAFDRFGNKWFGTTSNNLNIGGLVKFDGGDNWTVYNRTNSGLPGNLIGAVAVDSLNNIWASVQYNGIVKFDGTSWTVHTNVASFDPAPFIAVDVNNVIWIGSVGSGLYKYNGTNWTNYHRYNSGIGTDYIHCAAIENGTTLWLGTLSGGLIKYDQTNFVRFLDVPLSHMYGITIDALGNKWVGGIGGVTKFTESSMTTYNVSNTGLPERWNNGISVDKNNVKWIASSGGGLARFDDVVWRDFNPYNHGSEPWPFPTDVAYQSIFDKFGNTWVAVYNGGIGKWNGSSWTQYPISSSNSAISIGMDSLQNIWAGDYNLGVKRLDQNTGIMTTYNITNSGLPGNYVYAFAGNEDSSIWIGTQNGLAKFKNNIWIVYKTNNSGIPNNWVTALDKDPLGNLWVGTYNGLAKFDGSTWIVYNQLNTIMPSSSIADIDIAPDGTVWIGCYRYQEDGGVAKFDGTSWQAWTTANSPLPHKQVEAISLDRLGNLWISCASEGIAVFKEGGVITNQNLNFTALPDNYILDQNFPNPFNPTTKISFSIPRAGLVNLKVFDISGREVADLVNEFKNAGQYRITFDGSSLSSGVYFYSLSSQNFRETKKMILVK